MIDFISTKILNWLIRTEAIDSEESDVYLFGIHYGLLSFINILTTFLIGFFLGSIKECVVFIAVYMPLRSYAGGYHARTEGRCYIASAILSFAVLSASKVYPLNLVTLVILLLSVLIIGIISPVEDENKPADEVEVRVYSRRLKMILSLDTAILLLLRLLQVNWAVRMICVSYLALGIILFLGVVRNRIVRRNFEGSSRD